MLTTFYKMLESAAKRLDRWPLPRVLTDEQPRQAFDGMESRLPEDDLLDAVHNAGFSTLTGKLSTTFQWNAQNNLTGGTYNPLSQTGVLQKNGTFTTDNTNTTAGGADLVASFQQSISAASSATINLASLTSILQTAITPARIKSCQVRLLSATDDPTITPAPTVSSSVTVTNLTVATPHPLYFATGGSGLTVALTGAGAVTAVAIGVAGTLYPASTKFLASPQQAGGSGCVFLVTVGADGIPSAVTFITGAGGAGYSAATVPAVAVGQFTLRTGDAQANVDVSAAGVLVAAASCNIKILNNDPTKAVTVELDFVLGST